MACSRACSASGPGGTSTGTPASTGYSAAQRPHVAVPPLQRSFPRQSGHTISDSIRAQILDFPAMRGETVRVACFGAGWAATNRHLPAMRAHGGFEVVAVADRHGERAEALARARGVPHHFELADPAGLPMLDEVDAVVCAAPPLAHTKVVEQALRAGKHVLCDKPLAVGAPEVSELADTAGQAGLSLCVMHNFQF